MKQIKIGTCIQGPRAEEWLPGFLGKGFETFSLNFHMSLEGTDLEQLAGKTEKLLEGRPERISTIGFYCNPIQYPEHRKTLEQVIRTAGRFGADHVSTFAGAFEDRPVEESIQGTCRPGERERSQTGNRELPYGRNMGKSYM